MRLMILRKFLPRGYEIVPIGLLADLADSVRPYFPAFGGDDDQFNHALNTRRAAYNVIARYRHRTGLLVKDTTT